MPDTSSMTKSESPTTAGFDQQISILLSRAQELQKTLSTCPVHETWESLCEIIESCRLGELTRHPTLEKVYTKEFNPLIKEKFGSVEKYLKSLLDFTSPTPTSRSDHHGEEEEEEEEEWWVCPRREELEKGGGGEKSSQFRVRKNDWGYSIPSNVQHFVVWVNKPLFHRNLCTEDSDSDSNSQKKEEEEEESLGLGRSKRRREGSSRKNDWNFVQEFGVSGLTGLDSFEKRMIRRLQIEQDPNFIPPPLIDEEEEERGAGAGKEIEKFVRNYWKVEQGFQTAWFANPPRLQSVPGLAHFHVLVRKKTLDSIQSLKD